jgi:hypothetical protein
MLFSCARCSAGALRQLPEENSNEERFARQDSRRYSGWTAAITIAVIVIVLVILIVVYQLKY